MRDDGYSRENYTCDSGVRMTKSERLEKLSLAMDILSSVGNDLRREDDNRMRDDGETVYCARELVARAIDFVNRHKR